jgi:hypothetical protein
MAHMTKIGGGKVLVGGTGYSIDKGRTLVGGTGYDISFGTQIGSLEIGASVFLNVGGVRTEFLVVHQGSPGSRYRNADGTWLLMKDIYERTYWGSTDINDYENSYIHSYLNGAFLGLFDSSVQTTIMQIKVPYWKGDGQNGALSYNANGLSTKLFLLSEREAGFSYNYSSDTKAGECLSYFSGLTDSAETKRVAYYNGAAMYWWLRDPQVGSKQQFYVWTNGSRGNSAYATTSYKYGVRPALVLPKTTALDSEFNVIA